MVSKPKILSRENSERKPLAVKTIRKGSHFLSKFMISSSQS
jgi:hypothetical protein